MITYYGELSILDHTDHRDYVIEAFIRNIFDPQSGLTKCYDPAYYDMESNADCILRFLSTSQHWRDSVGWVNDDWYVNIDRLTGNGKYLEYENIMNYILNPDDSWVQGQSYSRPSVWGNTMNVKLENLPKEIQDEIFVWMEYDYKGCQYSFFIATIEVRNIELSTCEQQS